MQISNFQSEIFTKASRYAYLKSFFQKGSDKRKWTNFSVRKSAQKRFSESELTNFRFAVGIYFVHVAIFWARRVWRKRESPHF